MKNLKTLIAIVAIATLFASCAKDGATGPAGATGAQGPQGATGPSGLSNITTSVFNVTSGNWTYNSTNYRFYTNLSVPTITSAVLSNGDVQIFQGDGTGTYWNSLPYAYNNNEWFTQISAGQVTVYYGLAGSGIPVNPGSSTFKVVVIPQ